MALVTYLSLVTVSLLPPRSRELSSITICARELLGSLKGWGDRRCLDTAPAQPNSATSIIEQSSHLLSATSTFQMPRYSLAS